MGNQDLKHRAYKILREKLINCEYMPGTMLNESQLSAEHGFSRTPIREALNRIEHEGFIRILPKKGIYVTDILLNDVMQIFQARLEMEPVILRMSGLILPEKELLYFKDTLSNDEPEDQTGNNSDSALHLFIIDYCGNRFIIETMHKVFAANTRVICSIKHNKYKIHDSSKEHLEIINLLLERNIDKAQQAMHEHIENSKKAALDYFYNMQSYKSQPGNLYKTQSF